MLSPAFNIIFYVSMLYVGALAATDAIEKIGNATVTKDKRQIQQPTQNFIPSNHQIGGGHQHHYAAASNEQLAAVRENI